MLEVENIAIDLVHSYSHYLYCGDSRKNDSFLALLGEKRADLIFADPPYNVKIQGHVCGSGSVRHTEFVCASGEMSSAEFTSFLEETFRLLAQYSKPGSIHFICMDWRHIGEISTAGGRVYSELKNICVWNKQLGGMGSLYRSQHELIFVFKHAEAAHINNVELGKHGRYRTNVWDFPSHSKILRSETGNQFWSMSLRARFTKEDSTRNFQNSYKD